MRTSLNEIKAIEDHVMGNSHPADSLLFEAKLILNPELRHDMLLQQQAYYAVYQYGRNQLKAEIEEVHQKLLHRPNGIIKQLKRLFNNS